MMSRPFVECISVNKKYGGRHKVIHALKNINLRVEKGEFVLLKGRSGAGKSTLLNLIGGLIRPTSGSIRIEDDIITALNNEALSRLLLKEIGIIFQSFNLLPSYNIFENIEIALAPLNLSKKEIYNRIIPYIEQFGLEDPGRMPGELSLGQQQKVAIIRTLIKQPSLILADEPTASVDDQAAGEILDYLNKLRRSNNATVILATHGIVPDSYADRLITIENGAITS